ncbi:uncharacterized protein CC84DRAFT_1164607 [Paraphaeosphaeria sporulosa]|uniref:Uncharacterized protein n=1 Tax=Paraphaeosphaeria sporulosa TaxID=1460663 RepID=A0A177CHQ4_9PLEO|nr:uncharacterized protein CC84DRAFT_1164607 [Paraphaeosphaeria sporulosa]OAG06307.1 hypothetical protein CC84DRAFT_1164607 [Paraphaeosphaeria sporulosa]
MAQPSILSTRSIARQSLGLPTVCGLPSVHSTQLGQQRPKIRQPPRHSAFDSGTHCQEIFQEEIMCLNASAPYETHLRDCRCLSLKPPVRHAPIIRAPSDQNSS